MALANYIIPNSYTVVDRIFFDKKEKRLLAVLAVFKSPTDSPKEKQAPLLMERSFDIVLQGTDPKNKVNSVLMAAPQSISDGSRHLVMDESSDWYGCIISGVAGGISVEKIVHPTSIMDSNTGKTLSFDGSEWDEVNPSDTPEAKWDSYFSVDILNQPDITLTGQVYKYLKENYPEFAGAEDC